MTSSPQVKTCGHRGEALPTSNQLINALIKKNDWGLLSGPKGTTHTHAFLCPWTRCLCASHRWEPSLAHGVSLAMPWHHLGLCWSPGPRCCQRLCPPSDSGEDGKPACKAVPWPGLFTGGDGPVTPSCNPFLQAQPQKSLHPEHLQQAHTSQNIYPWYIHWGCGVCVPSPWAPLGNLPTATATAW